MSTPILMYHRIADIPGDRISAPVAMFEQHLSYLKKNGYTTVSLEKLHNHLIHKERLPPKSVVLTFDDGYEDNYINALPLLKKYGMTGTVFAVAGWVGKYNDWEDYPGKPRCRVMNWEQLSMWHDAGMEIGCHTVSHPLLSRLDENQIREELLRSKKILEEKIGIAINYLCYPYGDFDSRVKKVTTDLGYKAAVAIFENTDLFGDDVYALQRIGISSRQPLWEFGFKVSRYHKIFLGMRILERKIKKMLR